MVSVLPAQSRVLGVRRRAASLVPAVRRAQAGRVVSVLPAQSRVRGVLRVAAAPVASVLAAASRLGSEPEAVGRVPAQVRPPEGRPSETQDRAAPD